MDEALVNEIAQVIACSSGDLMLAPTLSIRCAAIAVVAALGDRLVGPGMVAVDREEWDDMCGMVDGFGQWVDYVRWCKREDDAMKLTDDGMFSWEDLSYAVDEYRTKYGDDSGDLDLIGGGA